MFTGFWSKCRRRTVMIWNSTDFILWAFGNILFVGRLAMCFSPKLSRMNGTYCAFCFIFQLILGITVLIRIDQSKLQLELRRKKKQLPITIRFWIFPTNPLSNRKSIKVFWFLPVTNFSATKLYPNKEFYGSLISILSTLWQVVSGVVKCKKILFCFL